MSAHETSPAPTEKYAVIGTRPPRVDAVDKVTGRARYGPGARKWHLRSSGRTRPPCPASRPRSFGKTNPPVGRPCRSHQSDRIGRSMGIGA